MQSQSIVLWIVARGIRCGSEVGELMGQLEARQGSVSATPALQYLQFEPFPSVQAAALPGSPP